KHVPRSREVSASSLAAAIPRTQPKIIRPGEARRPLGMADRTSPVAGISLRELLPGAEIIGADDIRVDRCCVDSRQCRPGDLFVALPGSRTDGHDFALQAVQHGAEAILLSRAVPGLK